ncbi:MAG: hypothetical protein J4F36_14035 [Nitrosopumilaceae archaeon]|nr:hypothetical protein [Nitrosopumilaceae archaeon]
MNIKKTRKIIGIILIGSALPLFYFFSLMAHHGLTNTPFEDLPMSILILLFVLVKPSTVTFVLHYPGIFLIAYGIMHLIDKPKKILINQRFIEWLKT